MSLIIFLVFSLVYKSLEIGGYFGLKSMDVILIVNIYLLQRDKLSVSVFIIAD